MSDSIKVAIRVRPLIKREQEHGSERQWTITSNSICSTSSTTPYVFDRVFDEGSSTDEVYVDIAAPLVEAAMQGFNSTIFAYGQTASGKTFTMMGGGDTPGIIPQAVEQIYTTIENTVNREYLIRVSYMEIYNEQVVDLFGNTKKSLDIRENKDGRVFVSNLSEEVVINAQQILDLMKKGESGRHFGSTNMNERSSRSHTIFRVIIESRVTESRDSEDGAVNVSHMNLVDLAGSEKAKQTGATGQRLAEGGFINKSLSTLGQVICQLSEGSGFVNFRDSKLTRILQNSLGGNSRTSIICNITQASMEETASTLRFASSAKRIKNKPVLNEVVSDEAMLKRYEKQINSLQAELQKVKNLPLHNVHEENLKLQKKLAEKERHLSKLICVSSQSVTSPVGRSSATKRKRRETWCPGKGNRAMVPPGDGNSCDLDLALPAGVDNLKKDGFLKPLLPSVKLDMTHRRSLKSPNVAGRMDPMDEESDEELAVAKAMFSEELQRRSPMNVCRLLAVDVEMQTDEDVIYKEMRESVTLMEELIEEKIRLVAERNECQQRNTKLEQVNSVLKQRCEELEEEMIEMEDKEFDKWESKFIDESILEKQQMMQSPRGLKMMHSPAGALLLSPKLTRSPGGPSRMELRRQLENLEKTVQDAEAVTMETRKQLAIVQDEKTSLQQNMEDMNKLLERLENEKKDFDTYMSLERGKHQQRESELKDQLEEAYLQISQQHGLGKAEPGINEGIPLSMESSQLATSRMGTSLSETLGQHDSTPSQEVAALQDKMNELEDKLKSIEMERDQLKKDLEVSVSEAIDVQNELMDLQSQLFDQGELVKQYEARLLGTSEDQVNECENSSSKDPSVKVDSAADKEADAKAEELVAQLERETAALTMKISRLEAEASSTEETMLRLEAEASLSLEEAEQARSQLETANTKLDSVREQHSQQLQELEDRLDDARRTSQMQRVELEDRLDEEQRTKQDAEAQVRHLEEVVCTLQSTVEATEQQLAETTARQEQYASEINAKNIFVVEQELKVEKKAHDELREEFNKLLAQTSQSRDKLLSEANRDLDQKRQIEESENTRKEIINSFSQTIKSNQTQIEELNTQVYELRCTLQKAEGESELATHKLKKSEEECQHLKSEIRTMEDLQMRQDAATSRQNMDPEKMLDRIKKLSTSLDLTNQRCEKFQAKNKELEDAARKSEDVTFERNNLQRQLRDLQHTFTQREEELKTLRQQYSCTHSEIARLKMHNNDIQGQLDKAHGQQDLLNQSDEKLQSLQKLFNSAELEIKQLKEQIDSLQGQLDKAHGEEDAVRQKEEELQSMQLQFNNATVEIEQLKTQVDTLQEQLDKMHALEDTYKQTEEELQSLQQRFSSANSETEQLNLQIESLQDQLDKAKQETAQLEAQLVKVDRDHAEEMLGLEVHQQEAVDSALSEAKAQQMELIQAHEKELALAREASESLTTMSERAQELETKVQQLEKEKSIMENAKILLEEELEAIRPCMVELQRELEEKSDEVAAVYSEGDTVKDSLMKTAEQLKITQAEVTELHAQLQKVQDEYLAKIASLEAEHAVQIKTMEGHVDSAEDELKAEGEENKELMEKIAELERQLQTSASSSSQSEEVNQMKSELEKTRNEYMTKIASLEAEHAVQIKTMEGHVDSAEDELKAQSEEYMELMRKIAELEKQLKTSTSSSSQSEEVNQMKSELEKTKNEYLAKIASLEAEHAVQIKTMEGHVDSAEDELKAECEVNMELMQKIAKLEKQLETSTSSSSQSEEVNQMKSELERTKDEYLAKIASLEAEHAVQIKTMEGHVDSAEDELKAESEENMKLMQKIAELEKQLKTSASSSSQSEEVNQMKSELEKTKTEFLATIAALKEEHAVQIKTMEGHVDSAEDECKAECEVNMELMQKIAKLEKQLKTSTSSSSQSEEVNQMKSELEKTKTEFLAKIAALKEEHAVQIKTMEGHVDSAEDECKAECEVNTELMQKIAKLEKQLKTSASSSSQSEEVNQMKSELEKTKTEFLAKMAALKEEHAVQIKTMEGHVDSAEDECKAECEVNMELMAKIAKLEKQLKTSASSSSQSEEVNQMKSELEKTKTEFLAKMAALKEEHAVKIKTMEGHVDSAEDECKAECEVNMELMTTIAKLEKQLKTSASSSSQSEEVNQMKSELARTKETIKSMDHKIRDMGQKLREKELSSNKLQKEFEARLKGDQPAGDPNLPAELAKARLRISALEYEIQQAVDPYKKRVQSLEQDNGEMRQRVMDMKNEIRKLKNNLPDDSILVTRPEREIGSMKNTGRPSNVYMVQAERDFLTRENKKLKEEMEGLKRTLGTKGLIQLDLEDQVNKAQQKINQFKHYYKKHLSDEDRSALKEMANSPMKSITGARSRHDDRDAPAQSSSTRNWISGTSLLSQNTEQEGSGECKTQ